jgi:cytochrome c biogenesis protein CcmG/thiol:disulfide interchange protein DsbE
MYLLPVVLFALLAVGFYGGLGTDTTTLPSPLIDKPAPDFSLPPLAPVGHTTAGHTTAGHTTAGHTTIGDATSAPGFSTADLIGKVSLVNVFASWCVPCRVEHPVLNALAKSRRVPIYGINYKDKPEAARAWIGELGNRYNRIGADDGRVGIEWGVYGVPETFVVDREGRIRYKQVGPLTQADLDRKILPLIASLEK